MSYFALSGFDQQVGVTCIQQEGRGWELNRKPDKSDESSPKKLIGVQTITRKRVAGSAEVGTHKFSIAIKYVPT